MSATITDERSRIEYPPPSIETWICKQLDAPALLDGRTTALERRDRIRARVLELGWGDRIAGRRNNEPESWRSLFFRLYREPLDGATP